jgi:hypothetical protein
MGARLYAAMLTLAIFALFVAAWWRIYGRQIPVVGNSIDVLVVAFSGASAGGLLRFRPHRRLYALGVLSMVVAFIGLWLASPIGGQWLVNMLNDPNYFGSSMRSIVGFLGLLLPIGWVLLGASVAGWRLAITTYLIPGVALVVGGFAIGALGPLGSGTGQMLPWVPLYFLFEWPVIILVAVGVFGYAFD